MDGTETQQGKGSRASPDLLPLSLDHTAIYPRRRAVSCGYGAVVGVDFPSAIDEAGEERARDRAPRLGEQPGASGGEELFGARYEGAEKALFVGDVCGDKIRHLKG